MKELILKLNSAINLHAELIQNLSLEERTGSKVKEVAFLFQQRLDLENRLIFGSIASPVSPADLGRIPKKIQVRLIEKGLKVKEHTHEIARFEERDVLIISQEFFKRDNIELLFSDLIRSVVQLSKRPKVFTSKRKGQWVELIIDANCSANDIIVEKYIRQNFRNLAMKLFPKKYDRNSFNRFYHEQFIVNKRFGAVDLAFKQLVKDARHKIRSSKYNGEVYNKKAKDLIRELQLLQTDREILTEILFK